MSRAVHYLYLGLMVITVVSAFVLLAGNGYKYYTTPTAERVYHDDHADLKPSGIVGHGLGIAGSIMIIAGVSGYMARKRYRFMSQLGYLKYWLEFHIFLCTLGPVLILYHTSFKFGGLVAVSFWSMVAVFLSGIAGRFIYLQIPRSIEGRELTLSEIRASKSDLAVLLKESYNLDDENYEKIIAVVRRSGRLKRGSLLSRIFSGIGAAGRSASEAGNIARRAGLDTAERRRIVSLVRAEVALSRKIDRLGDMQNLFRYWHVAHMPFAMVMLIIMVIHAAVTVLFGYRWIFGS